MAGFSYGAPSGGLGVKRPFGAVDVTYLTYDDAPQQQPFFAPQRRHRQIHYGIDDLSGGFPPPEEYNFTDIGSQQQSAANWSSTLIPNAGWTLRSGALSGFNANNEEANLGADTGFHFLNLDMTGRSGSHAQIDTPWADFGGSARSIGISPSLAGNFPGYTLQHNMTALKVPNQSKTDRSGIGDPSNFRHRRRTPMPGVNQPFLLATGRQTVSSRGSDNPFRVKRQKKHERDNRYLEHGSSSDYSSRRSSHIGLMPNLRALKSSQPTQLVEHVRNASPVGQNSWETSNAQYLENMPFEDDFEFLDCASSPDFSIENFNPSLDGQPWNTVNWQHATTSPSIISNERHFFVEQAPSDTGYSSTSFPDAFQLPPQLQLDFRNQSDHSPESGMPTFIGSHLEPMDEMFEADVNESSNIDIHQTYFPEISSENTNAIQEYTRELSLIPSNQSNADSALHPLWELEDDNIAYAADTPVAASAEQVDSFFLMSNADHEDINDSLSPIFESSFQIPMRSRSMTGRSAGSSILQPAFRQNFRSHEIVLDPTHAVNINAYIQQDPNNMNHVTGSLFSNQVSFGHVQHGPERRHPRHGSIQSVPSTFDQHNLLTGLNSRVDDEVLSDVDNYLLSSTASTLMPMNDGCPGTSNSEISVPKTDKSHFDTQSSSKVHNEGMTTVFDAIFETRSSNFRHVQTSSKNGQRAGPLEPSVAEGAKIMRETKACRRCKSLKAKCSRHEICERCDKAMNSPHDDWPLCNRDHFVDWTNLFLPEQATHTFRENFLYQLELANVVVYKHKPLSIFASSGPDYPEIKLTVFEFVPRDTQFLAFQVYQDNGSAGEATFTEAWSPPLGIRTMDQNLRRELERHIDHIIQHQRNYGEVEFGSTSDLAWDTYEAIRAYYHANPKNDFLRQLLRLYAMQYFLNNSLTVLRDSSKAALDGLDHPTQFEYRHNPSLKLMGLQIKTIMLRMITETYRHVLKKLEDLLDSKNASNWGLGFCGIMILSLCAELALEATDFRITKAIHDLATYHRRTDGSNQEPLLGDTIKVSHALEERALATMRATFHSRNRTKKLPGGPGKKVAFNPIENRLNGEHIELGPGGKELVTRFRKIVTEHRKYDQVYHNDVLIPL